MGTKKNITKDKFKYFSEKDFSYQQSFLQEYFTNDVKFKVTLYKIDISKTKKSIYNQAKSTEKAFFPAIELSIVIDSYNYESGFIGKSGVFNETLKDFKFSVLNEELNKKNTVISRGDYIKYNDGAYDRFFEVTSSSNLQTDNTAWGYKPYYVSVVCQLVKDNAINIG